VHVALNDYTDIILFIIGDILLLSFPSKYSFQFHGGILLGPLHPVNSRQRDPLSEVMVEIVQPFLGEVGEGNYGEHTTIQDS
jgi:hypothetical protein